MEALVWDDANLRHLAQRWGDGAAAVRTEVDACYESAHYVPREVEYLTSRGEWQWQVHLTGRTPAGRLLTVACEIDAATGGFRPITVWPASPAEAARYREDFPDDQRED